MSKSSAFFVLAAGFLVTVAGVGGIEASMDDAGLLSGAAVAAVGVLSMMSGWLGLSQI
jgi:lysylphosphatidylglycerol synthetase-like protein (DUF2156 family)